MPRCELGLDFHAHSSQFLIEAETGGLVNLTVDMNNNEQYLVLNFSSLNPLGERTDKSDWLQHLKWVDGTTHAPMQMPTCTFEINRRRIMVVAIVARYFLMSSPCLCMHSKGSSSSIHCSYPKCKVINPFLPETRHGQESLY